MRPVTALLSLLLVLLLAACGGGGGPAPTPEPPLMFDSLGRQLAEADFGRGDPQAAGADGIAFDGGALANAQVTLTDSAGATRSATTDASGYYRVDIKGLTPPFLVKARRADGTQWAASTASAARTRAFVTINVSGLTQKLVDSNWSAARLREALAVPLAIAGLDPAGYDPVGTPLLPAADDRHASLLRSLAFGVADGRTVVVATLAGRFGGFADGPATAALFNLPGGVALDAAGNIYVADTGNHRIRKIDRSGIVSTLAGNGSQSHSDGPGATARFNAPNSLAVDSTGTVYVADTGNNLIRKVSAAGVASTWAGSGSAGFADGTGTAAMFDAPFSVALDAGANLLVSDRGNDSVRRISPAGVVSTLAGSGPVTTKAQFLAQGFHEVRELAVDPSGAVVVNAECPWVDSFRFCLLAFAADGSFSKRATSPLFGANFVPYLGLALDAGSNVFAASAEDKIVRLTPAGVQTTLAASGFSRPGAVALDRNGNLVIADTGNSAIKLLLP